MRDKITHLLLLLIALLALSSCTHSTQPEETAQIHAAVIGLTCTVDADCASACQKCSAGYCAADATKNGNPCDDGNACTTGETCSAGSCAGGVAAAAGTVCRGAANGCDLAETCAGTTCPADAAQPAGTACADDGNVCTTDTCALGFVQGLSATYYSAIDFTGAAVSRVDSTVDFDWSSTPPIAGIGLTNYSVRWTGQVLAPNTGSYTFETESDDGVRLYVDGALVIDKWIDQGATKYPYTVSLTGGTKHDIKMEFYQKGGGSVARLRWSGPSIAYAVIPSADLFSTSVAATPACVHAAGNAGTVCRAVANECDVSETCTGSSTSCPTDVGKTAGTACTDDGNVCTTDVCGTPSVPGLSATYFSAKNLTGTTLSRVDTTVNFDWSATAPDPSMALINYSVRWTGQVLAPSTGSYTFETESDDGVRLYFDGVLVIDKWIDQGATKYAYTVSLTSGTQHDIKMEYYQAGGGAVARLRWTGPSIAYAIIPSTNLFSTSGGSTPLCMHAAGNAGTLCRASAGVCDTAETCTGVSTTCPADTKAAAGTVCRTTSGACDVAETCTGSSNACPSDAFAASGTLCRASAGTCDVAEVCTGSAGACPADTYIAAGTVCRAAANECDVAEACTGSAGACPADAFKATGTACTDDGNVCTTDACGLASLPGLSATYFNTINLTGATVSRVDTTVNFDWSSVSPDPAIALTNYSARWTGQVLAPNTGSYTFETETDDGGRLYFDGVLVIDKWIDQAPTKYSYTVTLTAGTKHDLTMEFYQKGGGSVARLRWTGPSIAYAIIPSSNLFSTSSGAAVACLHNAGNAGTVCRASVGVCDAAETCNGSSTNCPADASLPVGTVCRAAAGPCDTAETCSGAASTCPANVFAASGTVCRVAAGVCDVAETCSGASANCPTDAFVSAGTACRAAMNECDQPEACTGSTGACPADVFKTTGTACTDDGNICTADTCDVGTAQGLSVTYFASTNLTGTSVTRIDSVVDFNWGGSASPDPLIPTGNFSARWTGQVLAPNTGPYTFETESDDGVRFWLDGTLVIDRWIDQGPTKYSYSVALTGGTNHDVKMEYYQGGGGDVARLRWTGPSIPYGIIPAADLFPSAAGASVAICTHPNLGGCSRGLTATYYDNMDFTGPSVARTDPTIDFDWGNGSPDPAIGVDTFSARWTGLIQPAGTGTYTFETETDDGVRLWVNGVLLVDKFVDQGPTKYAGTIDLVAGTQYDIKMDYYENGGGAAAHLRLSGPSTSYGPIPNSWLYPSGDSGSAGLAPAPGGNNGTGDPYVVWQLSNTPGTAPVNVSSQTANTWGLGNSVMMVPAFSPDGTKLVFVDGDGAGGAGWRKGLSLFDFDETNKIFSNRRAIRNTWPLGDVMKWPTFESDSRSVVFQTSTPTELCTTCDGKTGARYGNMAPTNYYGTPGTLWSTDSTTNTGAVQLTNLNTGERSADANKSYQPTVLPVSVGGYRWAVFTSTRPYGNTINDPGTASSCLASQLWVSAIDDTVSGATDRSHPAFWMPNQNIAPISASNYINERAYWVLDPCKVAGTGPASACQTNEDCCGAAASPPTASCRIDQPAAVPPARHCVAVTPNTCSADGGSCTTDNDCCGYPGSHCFSGVCKPPPPVSVFQDASFFRDYEGVCPKGSSAIWRFFDWKGVTPSDSQIVFSAQTAETSAELDASTSTVVGSAQGPSSLGWTGVDVGSTLPQQVSRHFLRITMLFKPSGDNLSTPSLTDWRQSFSCVPSE